MRTLQGGALRRQGENNVNTRRIISGIFVAVLGMPFFEALPAMAADDCVGGAVCRWKDSNYSNCKASASGDVIDYSYSTVGWDTCTSFFNPFDNAISSVSNHGNVCWVTFYVDPSYSGAAITFDRINHGFTYADLNLKTSNTGYNGAGSSAIGGPYNTASRNDMISSHDFCS
jgi:hypothetical protein